MLNILKELDRNIVKDKITELFGNVSYSDISFRNSDNSMSFDNIDTPQELLDYMGNNIKYGFITKDGKKEFNNYSNFYDECMVQTGKEVLITKVGTCWDQVELERMWFIEHGYNIKTYFISREALLNFTFF